MRQFPGIAFVACCWLEAAAALDRRSERPASDLERFKGIVHVDGYPGLERLCPGGYIQLAA